MPEINIDQQIPQINIDTATRTYHLPIASSTTLGGIKVGNNLTIETDGTLNAESTEYNLPVATSSTLGGVKLGEGIGITDDAISVIVDQSLSSSSTNPVRNSVITTNINSLSSDISTLDNQYTTLNQNLGTLTTTVTNDHTTLTNLVTTVGNQATAIETNTEDIGNNESAISDLNGAMDLLDGRVSDCESDITDLKNGSIELTSDVTLLKRQEHENITNSYLLPVSTWTDGSLQLEIRGKSGVIYFNIEGSLSLGSTPVEIYTLTDNIPDVDAFGTLYTDAGAIGCKIDTNGSITLINLESASKTITSVIGSISVVYQ